MPSAQFDVVFRGVREGYDPALVKGQFARLFKLEAAKVERIFKSGRVTLKANADERVANIFVARLLAIGVIVDKLPVEVPVSKAIYTRDHGEVSTESHSMHQPVEFLYGESTRRFPLVFSGTGVGYFKIWLVNFLICLLSAGILYPWAQVRATRYFYQHTQFDNVEFSYASSSQKIFLVQFFLALYVIALCYVFFLIPWLGVVGALLLLLLLPYYFLKRSKFQFEQSFYQEVHFQQKYNLIGAYKAYLLLPLLILVTAGLAAPYVAFKIQQYRAESISIGGYTFFFSGALNAYLRLLPMILVAELCSFMGFYYREHLPMSFSIPLVACLWVIAFVQWRVSLVNLQWNFTRTKLGYFVSTWDIPSYTKLVTKNAFLCVLTLGIYWPWARVAGARYKAENLAFFANPRFKKWRKSMKPF